MTNPPRRLLTVPATLARLTADPARWNYKKTGDIARLLGITPRTAYLALTELERGGFKHQGGTLCHTDANAGKTVQRGNQHFVWFFQ